MMASVVIGAVLIALAASGSVGSAVAFPGKDRSCSATGADGLKMAA